MNEQQLNYEACMNAFYGEKINKHFGANLIDLFGPSIASVAKHSVLRGQSKEETLNAVTTTAEAMVVGMRAVLNIVNSAAVSQLQPCSTQTEKAQEDPQTEA